MGMHTKAKGVLAFLPQGHEIALLGIRRLAQGWNDDALLKSLTLEEALKHCGWNPAINKQGYFDVEFSGKLDFEGDKKILDTIQEFLIDGSHIQYATEYGLVFRYQASGGRVYEIRPKWITPDKEVQKIAQKQVKEHAQKKSRRGRPPGSKDKTPRKRRGELEMAVA